MRSTSRAALSRAPVPIAAAVPAKNVPQANAEAAAACLDFIAAAAEKRGRMPVAGPLALLIVAALLEAGGDAVVRAGLHAGGSAQRAVLILGGGLLLLAYGLVVNTPAWDFGRLLGVYVALFFVVAQVINLVAFQVRPGLPTLVGGCLVVAGGLTMTLWRTG